MKDIKNISNIYFIGIGGIGMSALALYFNEKGVKVSGYDKTKTELTKDLANKGIVIHYSEDLEKIDKSADVVVYTPAIPKEHKEFIFYQENNYEIVKRSDILGEITKSSFNICVAGTHGKTTISTMIAHILRETGYGCTAFLGGISVNYQTNYWSSDNNVIVVEADEYDRSFLRLYPDIAIISSMDADHLDIYGNIENLEAAFIDFSKNIKADGTLISKHGLRRSKDLKAPHHIQYHLQNDFADAYASDIQIYNGSYTYNVKVKNWMLAGVTLNVGGMHNVENSVAAITVAHQLGIEDNKIRNAVKNFKGVKRRFEYILSGNEVYIDDYAHHPAELKALITGAKALYSDRDIVIIFQPHLYTRTRDFADEFAHVLDLADEVILLPIYPARELPIEGVNCEMILDKMNIENKRVLDKQQLLEYLRAKVSNDDHEWKYLFITAGAGDIDQLVEPIKQILIAA
jgi:UDP-N-acetylmuramate--alanine ligase